MAVNIDTVYQTVLALANKEQRGYITPLEFNLMASKAQREIFEQYFYDINKYNRLPGNSTEFSDMLSILEEKIAPFRVNGASLLASTNIFEDTFEADITGWSEVAGANGVISNVQGSILNNFNGGLKIAPNNGVAHAAELDGTFTLIAGKKYVVNYDIIDMVEPVIYQILIDDAGQTAHHFSEYEPSVNSGSFTFIADTSGVHNIRLNTQSNGVGQYLTFGGISVTQVDNTTLPADLYRLGSVAYKASGADYPTAVAEVNANQLANYNLSPLARPTTSNPAYVRSGASSISVYPTTLGVGSSVTCNYIKTPTDPYWGYVVVPKSQGGNEYPLYDSSTAVDFELHESEETTIINKILEYAGVIMKQPDVIQYANQKQAAESQQENS